MLLKDAANEPVCVSLSAWRGCRSLQGGEGKRVMKAAARVDFKCRLSAAGLVCCSLNQAANFQIDTYSNPIPEGAIMVHSVMGYYLGLLHGGRRTRMKGGRRMLEHISIRMLLPQSAKRLACFRALHSPLLCVQPCLGEEFYGVLLPRITLITGNQYWF